MEVKWTALGTTEEQALGADATVTEVCVGAHQHLKEAHNAELLPVMTLA